jgi:two-component system, sensor histidine kinase RegB
MMTENETRTAALLHSQNRADAVRELAPSVAFPWVIRLRYGLALMEVAIAAAAVTAVRAEVPLLLAASVVGLTVISNVMVQWRHQRLMVSLQKVIAGLFCLDILSLTAILMLTGGASNPFSLLYLVQITLSATILNKYWTWFLGLLSVLCFGTLFWLYLPIAALGGHHAPGSEDLHLIGMWIGFAVAAFLIALFSGQISEVLRRREQELRELQQLLAKRERLASLATLAAGAAHELATPLGTIAVVAKDLELYASETRPDSAVAEDSRLIRSEVERCRRILEGMSAQGAELPGEMPVQIATTELLDRLRTSLPAGLSYRLEIRNDVGDAITTIPVRAVIQSLTALIKNGVEAGAKTNVSLRVSGTGGTVSFAVHDDGAGMSEEVLQRIAEPFFTTKPPGNGMGLGTFLVRAVAEGLGGVLQFQSSAHQGTTATLELPATVMKGARHIGTN